MNNQELSVVPLGLDDFQKFEQACQLIRQWIDLHRSPFRPTDVDTRWTYDVEEWLAARGTGAVIAFAPTLVGSHLTLARVLQGYSVAAESDKVKIQPIFHHIPEFSSTGYLSWEKEVVGQAAVALFCDIAPGTWRLQLHSLLPAEHWIEVSAGDIIGIGVGEKYV